MLILLRDLCMILRSGMAAGWIILAALGITRLPAAELSTVLLPPPSAAAPGTASTNSAVRQIGPGLFQIGEIRFDRESRSIRLPATVNMREGNIEYFLVTANGKTHESLLRTSIEPFQLQLAFLLLGAKGAGTNALPLDPAQSLPGEKVQVELSWKTDAGPQIFRAEEFVHDRKANQALSRGPWIYNGSRIREDGFAAQLDGSIISLITDADALLNNPRPGREDDDNWLVRTNNLPAVGFPLEVILRLQR